MQRNENKAEKLFPPISELKFRNLTKFSMAIFHGEIMFFAFFLLHLKSEAENKLL